MPDGRAPLRVLKNLSKVGSARSSGRAATSRSTWVEGARVSCASPGASHAPMRWASGWSAASKVKLSYGGASGLPYGTRAGELRAKGPPGVRGLVHRRLPSANDGR